MPRRCRGIRGDVGIAPYGRATRVRSYNVSPSGASRCLSHRGRRGDAAALPRHTGRCGHRPLRKGRRKPVRRGGWGIYLHIYTEKVWKT